MKYARPTPDFYLDRLVRWYCCVSLLVRLNWKENICQYPREKSRQILTGYALLSVKAAFLGIIVNVFDEYNKRK